MPEASVDILKLASVTLTREKQDIMTQELRRYFEATNFALKTIVKNHLTSRKRASELLLDDIVSKFVFVTQSGESRQALDFGRRFNFAIVTKFARTTTEAKEEAGNLKMNPEEMREEFATRFATQYVDDLIRTAFAEVARYRKLANIIVSMREKPPYFKYGTMIVSGMFVDIDDRGISLLTAQGNELSIPFDKRSRNKDADVLQQIVDNKQKYTRVRLKWNLEGFLNIDVRLLKS
ncbi:MAG: hypothetical protein ACFFEF_14500 [Candidatus Thorarchaeota archaeon]